MSNKFNSERRRESLMQQRLRRSRGEDVEEWYGDDYDDDEMMPPYIHPTSGSIFSHYGGLGVGTGCAPTMFYILLFGVSILAIIFLFAPSLLSQGNPLDRFNIQLPGLVASPTPTIRSTASVVVRIQELKRLETTSYTVEKVIEAGIEGNAFEELLFGDRLLLIAHGTVIAGLDLSRLQEEDISISEDGKTVTIRLPPVEIFSATLDNNKTRVYDREQGLLAATNKDLETLARQTAEQEILNAACEEGIMERATSDGRRTIEHLMRMLDFERVEIKADSVPSCPDHLDSE